MATSRRNRRQMQAANDTVAAVSPVSPEPQSAETPGPAKVPRTSRVRMMRQYDLVDRVRAYNPNTDEDLLNRAWFQKL